MRGSHLRGLRFMSTGQFEQNRRLPLHLPRPVGLGVPPSRTCILTSPGRRSGTDPPYRQRFMSTEQVHRTGRFSCPRPNSRTIPLQSLLWSTGCSFSFFRVTAEAVVPTFHLQHPERDLRPHSGCTSAEGALTSWANPSLMARIREILAREERTI